jgi:alkylation response protein AidB-like acyl-CoA dehydrogenase
VNLNPDQQLLAETVREVASEQAPLDRTRREAAAGRHDDPDLWRQISELGWPSLLVPEDHGGIGLGLPDAAVLARELGRGGVGTPLLSTLAVTVVIARHGTPEQQAAWLPAIADGSMRIAAAVRTPDDIGMRLDNGGAPGLSGTVRPVAGVDSATHVLVPFDGLRTGVALLAADELSADPITTIDLTRAYFEINADNVGASNISILPADALETGFNALVALQAAESLGAAERLLEMTVTYLTVREQFGRPIGTFQALQHRCADMAIELAGGSAAVQHAATRCELDAADTSEAVSVAAAWVGPGASWVAGESLQLHGGVGFTWEHDLHIYLRRIKANELVLGTPRWHRERVLAELLRRR